MPEEARQHLRFHLTAMQQVFDSAAGSWTGLNRWQNKERFGDNVSVRQFAKDMAKIIGAHKALFDELDKKAVATKAPTDWQAQFAENRNIQKEKMQEFNRNFLKLIDARISAYEKGI